MGTTLAAIWLGLALGAPAELHVAPNGRDTNAGTPGQPFATPARAQAALRALKAGGAPPAGGVTIVLHGGTYELAQPLTLTAPDGGTAEAPVIWRAAAGETVWLSGGRAIRADQWQPVTDPAVVARLDPAARGHVRQLDLRAAGVPRDLPELPDTLRGFTRHDPPLLEVFSGDRRMTCARWPNEGFARFGEIVDFGSGLRDPKGPKRPGRFRYEGDRPSRWKVDEGVWANGFWARAYLCEIVRFGQIDTQRREIEWAAPLGFGLDTWGANRYYVFNVLEELDAPGEWYLDRQRERLYFWPPAGAAARPVVLSVLDTPLVSVTGAAQVRFERLGFECGRQDALRIQDSRHCRVTGCRFRNTGQNAVVVTGGEDVGVVGCDIHDTGYAGVRLSGGDRRTLTPCGHFADNNHIHHTSVTRRVHAGPISLQGVGLRAAHNLIHHEPHSAIWYQGNDLTMEYNDIYWCHFETSEGGVFYTGYDWTTRGNVIRFNHIHHINDSLEGSPTEVNIVHEDDCSAGTLFYGNLCVRCGRGVSMCGGPDNIADNNIFVDVNPGVDLSDRGLQWWTWTRHADGTVTAVDRRNGSLGNQLLTRLARTPYREAPWTKYPHLADILDREPIGAPWYCAVTRNIAVGARCLIKSRGVNDEWVTIKDNWDNEGDPGFVDAARGDYRLKPDSPLLKRGFTPLPLDQIGLVNDGTRASWPVVAEPPPAGYQPAWLVQRERERRLPTALPVVTVRRRSAQIKVDGVFDPGEWTPAQNQTIEVRAYDPLPLRWNVDGTPTKRPSTAWLECDDEALYAIFVNEVDPTKGVSRQHRWGQDDAVEIALAPVADNAVGEIRVLRGYSDGTFESSDEAGAKAPTVKQALAGVSYACRVPKPSQWVAEWRVPFAALGLDPRRRNLPLLFNLSVRKPAGDLWVMWKQGGGFTWRVQNGGVLWLEPFGDITLGAAVTPQARIDVEAVTPNLLLTPAANCEVAGWVKPAGKRLTGSTPELPPGKWQPWRYAFTPQGDGEVVVQLMGRGYISPITNALAPVWVAFDRFTATGAALTNGSFEQVDAKGQPAGWTRNIGAPLLVTDARRAGDGQRYVRIWHDGRYAQVLRVTKGQTVELSCLVRGSEGE